MSVNDNSKFDELKTTGLLPSPKSVALAVMELAQDENATNTPSPENSRKARAFALCHGLHLADYFSDLCLAPEAARPAMLPNLFLLGSCMALDADRVSTIAEQSARDWQEWGPLLQVQAGTVGPITEKSRAAENRMAGAAQGTNEDADARQKLRLSRSAWVSRQ